MLRQLSPLLMAFAVVSGWAESPAAPAPRGDSPPKAEAGPKDDKEAAGVIVLDKQAKELAEEFKENEAAAKRKYSDRKRNNGVGIPGNALVKVSGKVVEVKGRDVELDTAPGLPRVILRSPAALPKKDTWATGQAAFVKRYNRDIILIETTVTFSAQKPRETEKKEKK